MKKILLIAPLFCVHGYSEPVNGAWSNLDPAAYGYQGRSQDVDFNANNSLAKGKAAGFMAEEGTAPSLLQNTGAMDRADNLNQAAQQAGAGSTAAGVAGGLMLGAGIPMSRSIILPVSIAGYQLIGMGVLETIQSAASDAGSFMNNARKDFLRREENDIGSQSRPAPMSNFNPINYLPSGARNLLAERNLDPQDYISRLMSGELNDPKAIAKYFGAEGELDDDALSQIKEITDGKVAEVFSSKNAQALSFDEKTREVASVVNGSREGAKEVSQPGSPSSNHTDALNQALKAGSRSEERGSIVPPSVPLDGATWGTLMGTLGIPGDMLVSEKKAMAAQLLGPIGVELPSRGMNIFEKARSRYQKFNAWLQSDKVAAR